MQHFHSNRSIINPFFQSIFDIGINQILKHWYHKLTWPFKNAICLTQKRVCWNLFLSWNSNQHIKNSTFYCGSNFRVSKVQEMWWATFRASLHETDWFSLALDESLHAAVSALNKHFARLWLSVKSTWFASSLTRISHSTGDPPQKTDNTGY